MDFHLDVVIDVVVVVQLWILLHKEEPCGGIHKEVEVDHLDKML